MTEGFISRTSLIAYGAWLTATVLFAGSWYIAIYQEPYWLYAVMSIATALGFTAIAAVAHFRLYMLRTCSLIRAVGRREGIGEVRAVR